MRLMVFVMIMVTAFSIAAYADQPGCAHAEKQFETSLKEFRMAKGYYCQAYLNCGTAFGFPGVMVNVDLTLSIPGGEDSNYDSCMAQFTKDLNQAAKDLTSWELALCEERENFDDVYYLCGGDAHQARGGTANRHLAPLPIKSEIISQR